MRSSLERLREAAAAERTLPYSDEVEVKQDDLKAAMALVELAIEDFEDSATRDSDYRPLIDALKERS